MGNLDGIPQYHRELFDRFRFVSGGFDPRGRLDVSVHGSNESPLEAAIGNSTLVADFCHDEIGAKWIPAYAGMTGRKLE